MSEKIPISFNFTKKTIERPIFRWHLHERVDLVAGYEGPRHKPSRMRRYLRVRTKMLHVTYYVWNGRDKGDTVRFLRNIHLLKQLTPQEVAKHYNIEL